MKETTTIYLVRHGQTEWNVLHRFQGHMDSPLTKLGIQQAEWLGEALQHDPIDLIYSSTSNRAFHTAEIIRGNRDVAVTACDEFKEINLGVWEGQHRNGSANYILSSWIISGIIRSCSA